MPKVTVGGINTTRVSIGRGGSGGSGDGIAAYNQANAAYLQANAAYDAANAASAAGTGPIYDKANAANLLACTAFTHANGAFDKANAANLFAFTVNINTAAAFGTANAAAVQAQLGRDNSNAAFDKANSANLLAFTADANASAAFGRANSAVANAGFARDHANSAFAQANTATSEAALGRGTANTGFTRANAAFSNLTISNTGTYSWTENVGSHVSTGASSNTIRWIQGTGVILALDTGNNAIKLDAPEPIGVRAYAHANGSYITANAAFDMANSAVSNAAAARAHANSAYAQANTATTDAANARAHANSAYAQANTATSEAALARGTANGAYTTANGAFGRANASFDNVTISNSGAYSWTQNVGSFTAGANDFIKFVQGEGTVLSIDAGNNVLRLNAPEPIGVWANGTAIAAFGTANAAAVQAQLGRDQANTARDTANNAYTNSNGAFGTANSATTQAQLGRDRANAAFSNVYITNVATGLNFTQNVGNIVATSLTANVIRWIQGTFTTLSVDPGNNAIKLDATIAPAWDSANSAQTQAVIARDTANGAFTKANAALANTDGVVFAGELTVTGNVTVRNEAYDSSTWDGNFDVPTKNAVRDKIESVIGASGDPSQAFDRANASFSNLTISNTGSFSWTENTGTILATTVVGDNLIRIIQGAGVVLSVDPGNNALRINATATGGGGINNVVEDTSPELGGNLDGRGFFIWNIANLSIANTTWIQNTVVLKADATWQNANLVFTGMQFNVWDANSAAGSLFIDFRYIGNSKFSVSNSGYITTANTQMVANLNADMVDGIHGGTITAAFDSANSAAVQAQLGRDQANTARDTANNAYTNSNGAFGAANAARTTADAAFGRANASLDNVHITNTDIYSWTQNVGFLVAGANDFIRIVQGEGVVWSIDVSNNAVRLNAPEPIGIWANGTAAAAFTAANNARTTADSAYNQANLARATANAGFTTANGAFDRANASFDNVHITNTGTYSWTQNVGAFTAGATDFIKVVQGEGTILSIDAGNNAVRLNAPEPIGVWANGTAAAAFGTANNAASEAALGRTRANASFSNVYITNVSAGLNFTQNVGSIDATSLTDNVIRIIQGNGTLWSVDPGNNALKIDVTAQGGGIAQVADDPSPELGGSLDGRGFFIWNIANLSIANTTFIQNTVTFQATSTWQNANLIFTGMEFNIVDANSAATSRFVDYRINGNSKVRIEKTGDTYIYNLGDNTNYERLAIWYNPTRWEIVPQSGGTGSDRPLLVKGGGATPGGIQFQTTGAINFTQEGIALRWILQADTGHFSPNSHDTYDIGTDATRVRRIYVSSGGLFDNAHITNTGTYSWTQNVGAFTANTNKVLKFVQGNGVVLSIDSGNNAVRINATATGGSGINNVNEDTSPELGGNLDGSGFYIWNIANLSIANTTFIQNVVTLQATSTWQNANLIFTGMEFNIVDANSAATSRFVDYRLGSNSKVRIDKTGTTYFYNLGDDTNYERFAIDWQAETNVLQLRTDGVGTGQSRSLKLRAGTADIVLGNTGSINFTKNDVGIRWQVDDSGHFITGLDNSYDIGQSADKRPRIGYFASALFVGTLNVAPYILAAYGQANTATTDAANARAHANSGYAVANGAVITAGAAFDRANASLSNVTITNTSTGLNFTQNVGNLLFTGASANTLKLVQGFEIILSADAANGAIKLDAAPDLYNSNLWGQIVASAILGGALA